MKHERKLFWSVLTIFLVVGIWWTCYIPYNARNLYSAIPSNATVVTEHALIAKRWKTIATNPLTLMILEYFGIEHGEVGEIANNAYVSFAINKLASRNTVVGYSPYMEGSGEPAWVFATWGGGNCHLLRLCFSLRLIPGVTRVVSRYGHLSWVYDVNKDDSGPVLSLAVVKGMLVGCFSKDRVAVESIVNRIEEGMPIVSELQTELDSGSHQQITNAVDHGWVVWHKGMDRERKHLEFELISRGDKVSEGWVKGDDIIRSISGLDDEKIFSESLSPSGLNSLENVLHDAPDAISVMPYNSLNTLFSSKMVTDSVRSTGRQIAPLVADKGLLFAGLFGGDYAGKVVVRVPTLMLGFNAKKDIDMEKFVSSLLDSLNAEYKIGMISRAYYFGNGMRGVVLDTTMPTTIKIEGDNRPALVLKDGCLIFSSNLGALKKLATQSNGLESDKASRWLTCIENRDSNAYAWIDLESINEDLKCAIAAYGLYLMIEGGGARTDDKIFLQNAQAWVDSLKMFKKCSLWYNTNGSSFDLKFKLGENVEK